MTALMDRPVLLSALALALPLSAASAITIDGDFSDFGDDTIIYQNPGGGTGLQINDIRVTNDNDFVYFNFNFNQAVYAGALSNLITAIDVDLAPSFTRPNGTVVPSTGFNTYGTGLGTEAAFQGDFPFQQAGFENASGRAEVFNASNAGPGGTPIVIPANIFGGDGKSTAVLRTASGDPLFGTFSNLFNDGSTTQPSTGVEFSLAITGTLGDGTPIFTIGEEFGVLVGFADGFNGNKVGSGFFTPTAVVIPEPASLAVLGLGSLTLLGRRRSA